MATKSNNGSQPEDPGPGIPVAAQVQVVARLVSGLRRQRFEAEVVQIANNAGEDDMHPDHGVTYKEYNTKLEDSEARLKRKYKNLWDQVEGMLGKPQEAKT